MIKTFLILINLQILLLASQQILLVVSDDFNSSKATLQAYENGVPFYKKIVVNIGKNGLGWGLGEKEFDVKKGEPLKYEGDNKAPIGVFKLTNLFGYSKDNSFKMSYFYTSKELICVDDSDSNFYNQLIEANGNEKSFEKMKRKDGQYELGIVVAHNTMAKKGRGSCIFIHVQRAQNTPTAGCTSMPLADLKVIAHWLDKKKNPLLIQIPKSKIQKVKILYPNLKNSELLK
jgi:L,D-peptidoglycan transpeptidase YkuD (ErfK/YbiS/YcfS/YnhG family)